MVAANIKEKRRKYRMRRKLRKVGDNRARLSVHRSLKNIYAQVIDDNNGRTIASASSLDKELRNKLTKGSDTGAAKEVGKLVAHRALEAGVNNVVFDRGSYLFHGRVKSLAEGAREVGLKF